MEGISHQITFIRLFVIFQSLFKHILLHQQCGIMIEQQRFVLIVLHSLKSLFTGNERLYSLRHLTALLVYKPLI